MSRFPPEFPPSVPSVISSESLVLCPYFSLSPSASFCLRTSHREAPAGAGLTAFGAGVLPRRTFGLSIPLCEICR
jgi:hypothetical protein